MSSLCLMLIKSSWLNSGLELATLTTLEIMLSTGKGLTFSIALILLSYTYSLLIPLSGVLSGAFIIISII